ncbi:MAG: ATP-binding protein [Eubacterium sp.]|nr:ATP-binding protein [Eubacterium sp.]MCM1214872.1 ATP-binding protein [Lachnospiraceae bacterium]MCM1303499.1 ATP-binding protein [Butyrivibrio sp.]MCM1342737.1 ATP-binding protein [Muribaculaceae bacterium]MCM1238948.1 ATP-binding protein [Lachnospiraceae bacterium]
MGIRIHGNYDAGVRLYLSRMILERQGGIITAKRRMERGTMFKVTLPCSS